ncbi:Rmf/CrpP fold protein [Streptomyces sp. C10-9-1]|uniref:Rmf/CrpP fold protein n=1 Tax=Streptomyces sp. C10-9-1 TaxID=1859285 RepID=UPI003F49FB6E
MGFREAALRARRDGADAARAGRPPTDAPRYNDPRLTAAWVRGYVAAEQAEQ